jgi:DNA-binding NarL/FixJ family response regulator
MLTVLLSLPFIAPSIALNAACQFSHEHEPLVLWGSVALSAGAVIVVAWLPLAIMRAPGWATRFMLGGGFLLLLSFNLASGIGAVSMARSDQTGARRADNARLSLLTSQLSQAEASRKALAATAGEKTAAMADAELTALRQDQRWTRSKECADATLPDSRTFCAEYAQKQGARDAAGKVAELDASMTTLRARIASAQTATAGESEDPQADAMATALGAIWARPDLHAVGVAASVQKAMAAEILPAVATTAIAILFSSSRPAKRAPDAPRQRSGAGWRRFWRRSRERSKTNQKALKKRSCSDDPIKPDSALENKEENEQKLSKTERNRQILELSRKGAAQTDVALKMGVSVATVRRVLGAQKPTRDSRNIIAIKATKSP